MTLNLTFQGRSKVNSNDVIGFTIYNFLFRCNSNYMYMSTFHRFAAIAIFLSLNIIYVKILDPPLLWGDFSQNRITSSHNCAHDACYDFDIILNIIQRYYSPTHLVSAQSLHVEAETISKNLPRGLQYTVDQDIGTGHHVC